MRNLASIPYLSKPNIQKDMLITKAISEEAVTNENTQTGTKQINLCRNPKVVMSH